MAKPAGAKKCVDKYGRTYYDYKGYHIYRDRTTRPGYWGRWHTGPGFLGAKFIGDSLRNVMQQIDEDEAGKEQHNGS